MLIPLPLGAEMELSRRGKLDLPCSGQTKWVKAPEMILGQVFGKSITTAEMALGI
jgi:hypothetical protein